jgi:methylenetetrahydrofolate dehydrogenase (NADP+)/methenyltetrahydrofolate cyclohydrolase
MKYDITSIVKDLEYRYIFTHACDEPSLAVILSCSPTEDEISYLKQIYKASEKYGVKLLELRTCEPMQIAKELLGTHTDGIIRISDIGIASNFYIDRRIGCDQDLDGVCVANRAQWIEDDGYLRSFPCTALACYLVLLDYFDGKIRSKDISIINRSNVIGKPLALLLSSKRENQGSATVEVLHSQSAHIAQKVAHRDAIVTAMGIPGSFDYQVESNSTLAPLIIDAGIGLGADGKIHGDVSDSLLESEDVQVAKIGKLTTTILFAKLFGGFRCDTWL